MPIDNKPANLNKKTSIITRDGILDDFSVTADTDSEFTDNTNNVGSPFTQSGGELSVVAHATLESKTMKYQNRNCLAPAIAQPWVLYTDYHIETRVKIDNGIVRYAGIALTHADESHLSPAGDNNKIIVAIFDNGGGDAGLEILEPDGTLTKYIQGIGQGTYYLLAVRVRYNFHKKGVTDGTGNIEITAWLNGVRTIDSFAINRIDLFGHRLDGVVGLYAQMNWAGGGGGDAVFDYWACNRIDLLIDSKYDKSSLHKIPKLELIALNSSSQMQKSVGQGSKINVYARNNVSASWIRRWHGLIDDVYPDAKYKQAVVHILATHYSQLLDQRKFTGLFTLQKTGYIIADATNGIMNEAPEFTTNNVSSSSELTLTKQYYKDALRKEILRLSAEEDFLPYVDEDDDLHHEAGGSFDSGVTISIENKNLINWNPLDLSPDLYNHIVVSGTDIDYELYTPDANRFEGGRRTKLIVDAKITTLEQAERRAREYLVSNEIISILELDIFADFTLEIGQNVKVTIPDVNLGITEKNYSIIEIVDENLITRTQTIIVTENVSTVIDYLYQTFLKSQTTDERLIDDSAEIKGQTYHITEDLLLWCNYLVETAPDVAGSPGTWVEHESGKATVCNRAIAILSAMLANDAEFVAGNFASGQKYKLGTGTTPPKITNQDINTNIGSAEKNYRPKTLTNSSAGVMSQKATVTWDETEANGNVITESGYYVDRSTSGQADKYFFATDAIFAPYNTDTDILVHCVFAPFSKTSSDHFRITYEWFMESGERKISRSV